MFLTWWHYSYFTEDGDLGRFPLIQRKIRLKFQAQTWSSTPYWDLTGNPQVSNSQWENQACSFTDSSPPKILNRNINFLVNFWKYRYCYGNSVKTYTMKWIVNIQVFLQFWIKTAAIKKKNLITLPCIINSAQAIYSKREEARRGG
jgi:hypothetical protein